MAKKPKIIGLVPARNESRVIKQCLECLSRFTDGIVYLDDCSTDNSVKLVQGIARKHNIKILRKKTWHRDEPGDRNLLLENGRKMGGTHFIVVDADEVFTANMADGDFLRTKILELEPGDQMAINWVQLWRTHKQYRFDNSIWTYCYKNVIFCDDQKCGYRSDFIHTARVPAGLNGKVVTIEGYERALMHFQFVYWRNLLVKQSWYRCLERTRMPSKLVHAINTRYALSKNEEGLGTKPSPRKWFSGYKTFDPGAYAQPNTWYEEHVLEMFDQYSLSYFENLDIWDVNWGSRIAEDDVKSKLGRRFVELREARLQLNYDLERAIKLYRAINRKYGGNEAAYGLALCERRMSKEDKAMQRCEEILERSPDYTDALNLAGQIAWARRDAKAAEKYYSKALKVDPLFLDAQLNSDAMIWG